MLSSPVEFLQDLHQDWTLSAPLPILLSPKLRIMESAPSAICVQCGQYAVSPVREKSSDDILIITPVFSKPRVTK